HPEQTLQAWANCFWKKNIPGNGIEKDGDGMKRGDGDYGPPSGRDGGADRHRSLANEQNGEERGARETEEVNCEFEFAAGFHVRSKDDREHDPCWSQLAKTGTAVFSIFLGSACPSAKYASASRKEGSLAQHARFGHHFRCNRGHWPRLFHSNSDWHDDALSSRPQQKCANHQPKSTEKYRRNYITQVMRPERDTTKSNQHHQHGREKDYQSLSTFRFYRRQHKQQQLPIKQRRPNGMATGETVARPIDKPAVQKWPMPVHRQLQQFV